MCRKLKKKYGSSIKEVIRFKQDAEEKLQNFERGEEKIEELEIKLLDFFGNKDEYTKGLGYFNLFDQNITVNTL